MQKPYILLLATGLFCSLGAGTQGSKVETGVFKEVAHATTGRATISQNDGAKLLKLGQFKTATGPNVHVLLIAARGSRDDQNLANLKVERLDLGPLKSTAGDQTYSIPAGTDLSKFKTVAVFCEAYNVTFGEAYLSQ